MIFAVIKVLNNVLFKYLLYNIVWSVSKKQRYHKSDKF